MAATVLPMLAFKDSDILSSNNGHPLRHMGITGVVETRLCFTMTIIMKPTNIAAKSFMLMI